MKKNAEPFYYGRAYFTAKLNNRSLAVIGVIAIITASSLAYLIILPAMNAPSSTSQVDRIRNAHSNLSEGAQRPNVNLTNSSNLAQKPALSINPGGYWVEVTSVSPTAGNFFLAFGLENNGSATAHNVRVRVEATKGAATVWSGEENIGNLEAGRQNIRTVEIRRNATGFSIDRYRHVITLTVKSDEFTKSLAFQRRQTNLIRTDSTHAVQIGHVPNVGPACPKQDDRPVDCVDLGEGVALWLSVDKASYKPGESVRIRWTLINNGSTEIAVNVGTYVHTAVYNETGKAMWAIPWLDIANIHPIGPGPPDPKGISIKPGESFWRDEIWNMTRVVVTCFNFEGPFRGGFNCSNYHAEVVPLGEYTVKVSGLPEVGSEEFSVKFRIESATTNTEGKPSDSREVGEGINLTLSIDKPSYRVGEKVRIQTIITNNGSKNVTLFRGLPVDFLIINTSERAFWSTSPLLLQKYMLGEAPPSSGGLSRELMAPPGESRMSYVEWNMIKKRAECVSSAGNHYPSCKFPDDGFVPSGEYELRYFIDMAVCSGSKCKGISYNDYLKLRFTIAP